MHQKKLDIFITVKGCFYGTHCKSCNYDTINNMMKLLPSKEEWKESDIDEAVKNVRKNKRRSE